MTYTCPKCGSTDTEKDREGPDGWDTGDRVCNDCGYVGWWKSFEAEPVAHPVLQHYVVRLSATARVKASETVFAASAEEAKAKALKQADDGNVFWTYDGLVAVDVDKPSITDVTPLNPAS